MVIVGILKDIFGGNGERVAPSKNPAEREARTDYIKEVRESGGKDPIPKDPPSWVDNLPSPKGK